MPQCLEVWARSEQIALALARTAPRVRWQRADVDGRTLLIAWRERGDAFDHVTADEQPDRVTVTVYERFGPI